MLQTVAEYAAEQLARAGEWEQIADRHLAWFRSYAASANALLAQPDGHELIDRERANLRLALDRTRQRDPRGALQIAASLMRHWILAEHFQEARSTSAAVLAAAGGDGDAAARAVVLCGAGLTGLMSEDYAGAVQSTQAGLELLGDVQEAGAQSACLGFSSMVLIQTGLDLDGGLAQRRAGGGAGQRLPRIRWGSLSRSVNLAVAAMLCERSMLLDTAYGSSSRSRARASMPGLRTWASRRRRGRRSSWARPSARWSTPIAAWRWRASGRR